MAIPPNKGPLPGNKLAAKGPLGSEKATAQLVELEQKLERMRRKFAAYFNGFDRLPPTLEFEALKREFRELTSQTFSTGQSRFKVQNLIARWQLQRSMWERDLVRMEEGKFKPGSQASALRGDKDLKNQDD